jgi:cellobiose epimerase
LQFKPFIEKYGFDAANGGYFEAFSKEWQTLQDLRLSDKDRNDPKTMNTHLHIIEGYANLYSVWKNEILETKIRHLLTVFEQKIINPNTSHLSLFFSEDWIPQIKQISFGHDIEASWLLQACAKELNDAKLTTKYTELAIKIAQAAAQGFAKDGSLHHEFNPESNHYDTHREWWVSAEAMTGFLNTYYITQNNSELMKVDRLWNFTKKHLLDLNHGEWR